MFDQLYTQFRALPGWTQALALGATAYGFREVYDRMNEKELTGEVVVLTGAGSGIGREMALQLARCGCRLALWDLNQATLDAVVKEIRSFGGEARAYVADVTDRTRVYAVGEQVLSDFGQVDILINNAGIVSGKKLLDSDDALMEKTVQVNTVSHFWTLKAFLPGMLERNHGHIITIASMAGIQGTAGLVDYCASKYGAVGTAESLRQELRHLGKTGVHSTCVCPFYIKTGMFEGAKSHWPMLFPLLEPPYAASRIVTAIKRNSPKLVMPFACYLAPIGVALFPTSIANGLMDLFKINCTMDEFVQTRVHS